MKNTKAVGDASVGAVLAKLLKNNKSVLIPFGDKDRYDLVVDDGGFKRIQCKTGRIRKGSLVFDTKTVVRKAGGGWRKKLYDSTEIECFGVFCPEIDKVYIIPVDVVAKYTACLRVDVPKNAQLKKIVWAKNFEVV